MIQINDLGTSETEHLPKTLIYHGQNQKANIADIIMTVTMTMKKKKYKIDPQNWSRFFSDVIDQK